MQCHQVIISVLTWDGERVMPGQFGNIPFCPVGSSIRVVGIPDLKTFTLPFMCLLGPIMSCEIRPPAIPALSPFVRGVIVMRLCTGIAMMNTLSTVGIAMADIAMFG